MPYGKCSCCPTRVESLWNHGEVVECAAIAKTTGQPCKNWIRYVVDPRTEPEQYCHTHGGRTEWADR